ncbi:hypothetical protein D3C75_979610 [compost metagenome]
MKQWIRFAESNHRDAVRVELSTSLKPAEVLYGNQLAGNGQQWWQYSDPETLFEVLTKLVQLIIHQGGLEWLEINSTPDLVPSIAQSRFVLENAEELSRSFSEKYELSITSTDSINTVESLLLNQNAALDWELLMEASAFIGEVIISAKGGAWAWNEDYQTCAIRGAWRNQSMFNVLHRVCRFWGKSGIESNGLYLNVMKL